MKKKNNPPLSVSHPHSHQDTKSLKTNGARKVHDRRKQELKKKAEQLKTLYETGKKITSMISKEKLLPWIAKQAAKLLDAEVCNYRIREGNYLVRGGGTKEGIELMAKDRLKIGESLSGLIAKDKKPIVVSDNYYKDSRLIPKHRKVAAKYGFRSCLGVPMCIGKRVIGVLFVVSKKPKKFTKNDVELLTSFADHAAIAIENVRLFGDLEQEITERRKAEEEIKNKASQLRTLYETSKRITSMISKDKLLPWITEQAAKLLDTDACFFRIKEGDYLVEGGGTKDGIELMAKESIKIGEHLSGTIAKEKRPLIVDDIKRDQRYIARDVAKRLGYVSFLGVPMMIRNEVKGVICVYTKEPRKFTEKDIELLTSFADMAAVALEKAKLFEDLEQAKEKIEESEKNLKNFSGKILSIREDEKKRLASNLHDEFGSMEFAINSKLSIAEKAIEDNNLKEATRNINHIKKIIEKASMIFKEMATDLRPIDLDLIGLPNALKEYFSDFTKQSKIKIDFKMDINGKKFGDDVAIALYRVAQEALNNVSKHANATKVKISLYSHGNKIILNISDNGKGFDIKKDLQKKDKLLRMGLIGMRERVESLGGNFLIKSAPEKGTRISITLTN